MRAVMDSSALLGGASFTGSDRLYLPPGVESELRGDQGFERLRDLVLEVREPPPERLREATAAAQRTGDLPTLSRADLEVLALALDLRLPIVTDDYAIQNVAAVLGLACVPVRERGIREVRTWMFRCRSCGKVHDRPLAECPICGGEVRRSRPPRERKDGRPAGGGTQGRP